MVVAAAIAPRAAAFLDLNGGHDQVIASADYGITYDSNLFVHAGGPSDTDESLALGLDYTRRAGLIGVTASLSVTAARFTRFSAEDYANPSFTMELSKNQGRLTGTISLSAQRESNSDTDTNLFTKSWNYATDINLRYPINDRYYFTSLSDFSLADYVQNSSLYNLLSYSEAIDVFYVYTSKLDLMGGYRIRLGEAEGGSHTQDNALTFGATGGLLPKLTGNFSLGYQWRDQSGPSGGHYGSVTTNVSLSWPMTKRVTFNGDASKDFTTSATDISVDTTTFGLSASLKPNSRLKFILNTGVNYSISDFLGIRGAGRVDRAPSLNASLGFSLTTVVSVSISYAYTENHSNVAFSDFSRQTATFKLSARY